MKCFAACGSKNILLSGAVTRLFAIVVHLTVAGTVLYSLLYHLHHFKDMKPNVIQLSKFWYLHHIQNDGVLITKCNF